MNLAMQLIGFVVPLTALALLRPQDATAAALCWVLASIAVPPVQLVVTLDRLAGWLARRLVAPVLGTLVMGVAAAAVVQRLADQAASPALLGTALASALTYGVVVLPVLRFRLPRALQEASVAWTGLLSQDGRGPSGPRVLPDGRRAASPEVFQGDAGLYRIR